MNNRNRRDKNRATFGNAWRYRIDRNDIVGTVRRYLELPAMSPRRLWGPPQAPQLGTCTTAAESATRTGDGHTAPGTSITAGATNPTEPGFYGETGPTEDPAVVFSLSLDVETNPQEDS